MARDNRRMQRGSGIYTCEECGEKTRETGEGESCVKLCLRCWTLSGCINSVNDGNMTEAEDEQRQYWIERARQEDDVPIGSLRVWNVINPPCEPAWHPVETPEEGARLIDQLANEQLKNPGIVVNAFGLCEWDGEEWTEWYDDEGNDVDNILKENDDFAVI